MTKKKTHLKVYFDCETYSYKTVSSKGIPETQSKIYNIGWTSSENINQCWITTSVDDFINWLILQYKKHSITLYAYNIDYELKNFYYNYLFRHPSIKKYTYTFKTNKSWKYLSSGFKSSVLSFKTVCLNKWIKQKSLNDWAIELGEFHKEPLDHDKWNCVYDSFTQTFSYNNSDGTPRVVSREIEDKYLRNDVLILPRIDEKINKTKDSIVKLLVKTFGDIKGGEISMSAQTAGSFAKQCVNWFTAGSFKAFYRTQVDDDDIYLDIHRSNCGGYTSCNTDWLSVSLEQAIIKSYDINSMYPFIMTQALPQGPLTQETPPDWIGGQFCTWYRVKVWSVNWKEKYACMKTRPFEPNGVKRRSGDTVFLTKDYFDFLKKHCLFEHGEIEVWYQHKTRALKSFYDTLYEVKATTQVPGEKDCVKLIMNSSYGKFGEQDYHYEYQWINGKFSKTIASKITFTNILTGVFIIQTGRLMLLKEIVKQTDKGNVVLYCDTDSLHIIENVPPGLWIDKKEIGAWKPEGEWTNFESNGMKKKYLFYNKFKPREESIKLALSGPTRRLKSELVKPETDINLLLAMFNKDNNFLIKDCNVTGGRPNSIGQTILSTGDYLFNGGLNKKPTHMASFKEGGGMEWQRL